MGKKIDKSKMICLIILNVLIVLITVIVVVTNQSNTSYYNWRDNDFNKYDDDDDTVDKSYLRISDVKLNEGYSYVYCDGKITVSSYSPYKYRYIKVKAIFKSYYGTTIDTDWTYAIDSEWLEPGESKKFSIGVSKDYSIDTCEVVIVED